MVTLKQEEPDKRHIKSAPLTSVNMSSFTPNHDTRDGESHTQNNH